MQRLTPFAAVLSQRGPGFDPESCEFVLDKVAVGQVSLRVLSLPRQYQAALGRTELLMCMTALGREDGNVVGKLAVYEDDESCLKLTFTGRTGGYCLTSSTGEPKLIQCLLISPPLLPNHRFFSPFKGLIKYNGLKNQKSYRINFGQTDFYHEPR
jgi:hypothetical protein